MWSLVKSIDIIVIGDDDDDPAEVDIGILPMLDDEAGKLSTEVFMVYRDGQEGST